MSRAKRFGKKAYPEITVNNERNENGNAISNGLLIAKYKSIECFKAAWSVKPLLDHKQLTTTGLSVDLIRTLGEFYFRFLIAFSNDDVFPLDIQRNRSSSRLSQEMIGMSWKAVRPVRPSCP